MHRYLIGILVFLLSISSLLAEPIEQAVTVNASPLQAWRAMTVDWQIRQWSGAESAYFELREGGPWRITYRDMTLEEGIIESAEPGERLVYSFLNDKQESMVSIAFRGTESGCEIIITHDDFGKGKRGEERRAAMLERWNTKLPMLTEYLNQIAGSYLAKPYGEQTYPAVLLLHDRFGLNTDVRAFADSLAAKGYIALAVDMFKGDATSDMTQAAKYMELVNREDAINTAQAAFEYLRDDTLVNRRKIAVWGLGFGGSLATSVAARVPEFKLCVNWYGLNLPADSLITRIACPVFGVFAGPQPANGTVAAENFSQKLTQAGVRVETIIVQGSDGFADRAYGETFSLPATTEAWNRTLTRLDRSLRM
jgi:carboxymethylenebutenolidase